MKTRTRKWLKRSLLALGAFYLAAGLLLYLLQDVFLFHGAPLAPGHRFRFSQPFEEWNLAQDGNTLSILRFPAPGKLKGIVLFYHGNMRNVEHYASYPALFTDRGYECWMIDYPGFGKTTGKRSEARIYADALAMYAKAADRISTDSILVYGKSIGTGVAAYVASQRRVKQLVLETPYYDIPSLAAHYLPIYPARAMSRYQFPTGANLKKITAPVTLVHGTADEVIPVEQALRLKEENPRTGLVVIRGGRHNNLAGYPLFRHTLDSLLRY